MSCHTFICMGSEYRVRDTNCIWVPNLLCCGQDRDLLSSSKGEKCFDDIWDIYCLDWTPCIVLSHFFHRFLRWVLGNRNMYLFRREGMTAMPLVLISIKKLQKLLIPRKQFCKTYGNLHLVVVMHPERGCGSLELCSLKHFRLQASW